MNPACTNSSAASCFSNTVKTAIHGVSVNQVTEVIMVKNRLEQNPQHNKYLALLEKQCEDSEGQGKREEKGYEWLSETTFFAEVCLMVEIFEDIQDSDKRLLETLSKGLRFWIIKV